MSSAHAGAATERGSAIVSSLLLMAIFVVLGGAFLSVALTESLIASNEVAGVRAFHAAEAGLTHARAELTAVEIGTLLTDGGGVLLSDVGLGGGRYSVVVSNNVAPDFPRGPVPADDGGPTVDTDGYLVVTSTGRFREASRTVEALVKADSIPGTEWAVFGDYYLSAHVHGSLNGQVGTNGDMILRVNVNGDARAGGTIDYPSYVNGTATMNAPRVRLPDVGCPATNFGPSPIGMGVDFNAFSGDVEISGSGETTFPAGSYYFNDFTKSGTGRMRVASGDTVDIYVRGELLVGGNGFQNDNDAAARLRIWGCGTRNDPWRIAGDTPTWMFLYAIHHPLRILGDGAKNGSFVAASVFKSGAGAINYDSSLEREIVGTYDEIPGTWTERLD